MTAIQGMMLSLRKRQTASYAYIQFHNPGMAEAGRALWVPLAQHLLQLGHPEQGAQGLASQGTHLAANKKKPQTRILEDAEVFTLQECVWRD